MINLKDIKSAKHISDPTEEKLNDLKLVSQETDKEIVSAQGENAKDILRARSIERLDALEAGSEAFDDKIGERDTAVAEELTEITDRTKKVISDSEKYTEDIEAFLSVAKGDDFLFFLDDCTRPVGRLDKLTNGSYLCYNKKITSWDIPLPQLTNGTEMFKECRSLTNFESELPNLENGYDMFRFCNKLTSFKSKLPKLTNAGTMFENLQQKNWNILLPILKHGGAMFARSNLTNFDVPSLPELEDCYWMFYDTKLTSFVCELPKLKIASGMFTYGMFCMTPLVSFESELPNLENGGGMFRFCNKLVNFKSKLSKLINGTLMFADCKLNLASVQNIADTINDLTGLTLASNQGSITIGIEASLNGNEELISALELISSKGWTIVEQYN